MQDRAIRRFLARVSSRAGAYSDAGGGWHLRGIELRSRRRDQPLVDSLQTIDPASLRIEDSCASVSGGAEDGLFASDRIPGPPNTPAGREAGWRVTAPAGTRITRLTLQYYLGQFSAGEWLPFIRTAEGAVLESCVPAERADDVRTRASRPTTRSVLSACTQRRHPGLEAGVRCAAISWPVRDRCDACTHVWLRSTAPACRSRTLRPRRCLRRAAHCGRTAITAGSKASRSSASDNTGVRATRLRVDGFERGAAVRPCDFTYVMPCTNEPGAAIGLDTRLISRRSPSAERRRGGRGPERDGGLAHGRRRQRCPGGTGGRDARRLAGSQSDEPLHRSMAQPGRPGSADLGGSLDGVQAVGQRLCGGQCDRRANRSARLIEGAWARRLGSADLAGGRGRQRRLEPCLAAAAIVAGCPEDRAGPAAAD